MCAAGGGRTERQQAWGHLKRSCQPNHRDGQHWAGVNSSQHCSVLLCLAMQHFHKSAKCTLATTATRHGDVSLCNASAGEGANFTHWFKNTEHRISAAASLLHSTVVCVHATALPSLYEQA